MTVDNLTKLNRLINFLPRGAVVTSDYLRKQGYGDSLVQEYKKRRWLESVERGAYKLPGDSVEWFGGVYAMQKQLNINIHVGAKTSLSLQGYAQYIPVNGNVPVCHLFGYRNERLPAWFKKADWNTKILYFPTKLFSRNLSDTYVNYQYREFEIRLSSPERAAMEMCYLIPRLQEFEEAGEIIENLTVLRPGIVQLLLENCRFIKVKRLFLYFADRAGHDWFNELNLANINLGSGQRQIIKDGILDKKYLITIPKKSGYESFNF
ncbi:hypothetical protein DRQ07_01230 [candidate division KSB1 bacterium]|nr:MAG: hypothetical protein DRQ07_01230 [candidate division KSB1 bacterium]